MESCPSGELSKWGVVLVGSCPDGELFRIDLSRGIVPVGTVVLIRA